MENDVKLKEMLKTLRTKRKLSYNELVARNDFYEKEISLLKQGKLLMSVRVISALESEFSYQDWDTIKCILDKQLAELEVLRGTLDA